MCALPRATAVTTVYQRDSSSKRPRPSAVSAARAPNRIRDITWRTRHPGLRALGAAPAAPLDTAPATWSKSSYASKLTLAGIRQATIEDRGLDKGSFHIRLEAYFRVAVQPLPFAPLAPEPRIVLPLTFAV